jgi:hypothetical protein
VKITDLPKFGSLKLNNAIVHQTDVISVSHITAGKITYTPALNDNGTGYAHFGFAVNDDGGTTNGGVNTDNASKTMTFNVTAVNDARVTTNITASGLEDQTIAVTGWRFNDSSYKVTSGSSANSPQSVNITSLPANGSLFDNGVAVKFVSTISWADAIGGKVTFPIV